MSLLQIILYPICIHFDCYYIPSYLFFILLSWTFLYFHSLYPISLLHHHYDLNIYSHSTYPFLSIICCYQISILVCFLLYITLYVVYRFVWYIKDLYTSIFASHYYCFIQSVIFYIPYWTTTTFYYVFYFQRFLVYFKYSSV